MVQYIFYINIYDMNPKIILSEAFHWANRDDADYMANNVMKTPHLKTVKRLYIVRVKLK